MAEKKYSYEALIGLQAALRALGDGAFERVVGDGQAARVVRELYKLGELRLTIAINLRKVGEAVAAYNDARLGLAKEIAGTDDAGAAERAVNDNPKTQAAFGAAISRLLKTEVACDLAAIEVAALNIKENPIPATTLELLAPILKGI